MMDMNLAILGGISTSLKRRVLLLEIKELKERINTLHDGALYYKGRGNREMLEEIEASTNFIEKRMAEVHLELWGGCPAELGRSATIEEADDGKEADRGSEQTP